MERKKVKIIHMHGFQYSYFASLCTGRRLTQQIASIKTQMNAKCESMKKYTYEHMTKVKSVRFKQSYDCRN